MGEVGAIDDLVSGAVIARAIEPATGELSADGHTDERSCLNCAAPLTGDYCHVCGQHAHVHRTLSAFFHDLLHGVLHFEGKIWNTLPLLAWKPGDLTRRYIAGERAKFVSPMALFLFSVFLMFAILGATASVGTPKQVKINQKMSAELRRDEARLKALGAERAAAVQAGRAVTTIDARIADLADEMRIERSIADKGVLSGTAARVSDDVPAWLRDPIERAGKNPDLLLYKLKSNAYKWSWALIPLSVPFLWLVFPFSRRFRLYDHTVFVTYSLAFMTLLVCICALTMAAGMPAVTAIAMLFAPLHIYRHLRGAYALGRWGGLWRMVVLVSAATVVLGLFFVALVGLGLFD